VDTLAGLNLRYQGRVSPPELEPRQEVEREIQVFRDRRDDVVPDWQRMADGLDASLEQEVGGHRQCAAGIIPLVLDLSCDVQGVRHHGVTAYGQGRVIGDHRLGQIRQMDRHVRALSDAKSRDRRGKPVYLFLELAEGQTGVHETQGDRIAVLESRPLQEPGDDEILEVDARRNALVIELMPDAFVHINAWSTTGPREASGSHNPTRCRTSS
jgi:hypothetical protein